MEWDEEELVVIKKESSEQLCQYILQHQLSFGNGERVKELLRRIRTDNEHMRPCGDYEEGKRCPYEQWTGKMVCYTKKPCQITVTKE